MGAEDKAILDAADALKQVKSLSELVLDRQQGLENDSERQNFVRRAKEVITYCRDDLDRFLDINPGSGQAHELGEYQMTSRPMSNLEDAADAYCGNTFVPQGWFGYTMADPRLQGIDEIQAWLQRAEEYMGGVYANANLYPQMPNLAMDSLSIGEGIMFAGEDEAEDRAFVHHWEPLATWFARDRWGNIMAVHHRWAFNALEAYQRWGTKCDKSVVENALGSKPAEKSTYLQVIYKRNDPLIRGYKFQRERQFIELWVQEGSEKNSISYSPSPGEAKRDGKMNGILEQSGYDTMPVMDWPYWWKSSETYGRGPMHLVSIVRLHAMWRSTMLGAERNVAPPLLGQKSLRDELDMDPDGVTWVDNPENAVRPVYQGNISYEQGADLIDRMEAELRDMLKLNVFMAMTMKTKDMRVDEVMQVIGEQAALMAPRIGLMNSICLDNLHARMWSIEEQRGRLYQATNPPGIIMNYLAMSRKEAGRNGRKWRGLPIRVVYKGPMQLAQDSYFVQRRLMSGLAPINAYLVPIDAEAVADKIDVAVATEEVLDKTGFMQSAIRSKKAFDARQKKRAAAQAGLTDAQTAQGGARALRDVAEAARTVSEKQL